MTGCIAEVIFAIFGFFDAGVVLGGEYNGFDSERGSVSQILNGHLAFGVRASPCQNAFAAQAGVFIHEPVRNGDRQRHEFRSFVAGETEHHPLVAGTFFIHTLGDVRALGVNVAIDLDGGVSEPDFRVGVADFFHHVANNFVHSFTGQRGFCRNLTGLVVTNVSQATRLAGSCARQKSRIASLTWSATLSGWPMETDSLVNR